MRVATGREPHEVRLRNGSRVLLRPVDPGDRQRMLEAFERLSPESRYRRFLTPMERLTPAQLEYLTEVDHHDHEAMVAIDPRTEAGLGAARFVRDEQDHGSAEAAVTVVDDWQGRGLGTALLEALTDRAREEGIRRFTFLVLAENREMIEMLARLGQVHELGREPGTAELAVELPPAEQGLGAELGELLRSAAAGVARFVAERTGGGGGDPGEGDGGDPS